MLKPAQLYREELNKVCTAQWYDLRNMYYHSSVVMSEYNIPDSTEYGHYFVSVDKDDNVIGYLAYCTDHSARRVYNMGLISFDKGNLEFIRDIYQAFKNIFEVYHMHSMEWFCYADNPAIKGYRRLVKKYHGRECGYFRDESVLLDGKFHDSVKFEILDSDYFNTSGSVKLGCKVVNHQDLLYMDESLKYLKELISNSENSVTCNTLIDNMLHNLSNMLR